MKEVISTNGTAVIVDDDDYEKTCGYTISTSKRGNSYYVICHKNGTSFLLHRLIMGNPEAFSIDHIDGNGLNNQKNNLRICTHNQNMKNRRKNTHNNNKKKCSSIYKGVQKMYRAKIVYNGKSKTKEFWDEIKAAEWYDEMALKYHGEFACTNKMLGLL